MVIDAPVKANDLKNKYTAMAVAGQIKTPKVKIPMRVLLLTKLRIVSPILDSLP